MSGRPRTHIPDTVIDEVTVRLPDGPPPGWQTDAACCGVDPELFHPGRGDDIAVAVAICHTCPVQYDCLTFAIVHQEQLGIWGGYSIRHRLRIARLAIPDTQGDAA